MWMMTARGILLPFLGTSLGAACVFFMKKSLSPLVQKILTGFAAGVMVAASIWSLLIPAWTSRPPWENGPLYRRLWVSGWGSLFLLLLDHLIPHLHRNCEKAEGPRCKLGKNTMMVLAVALHNIPEGMAVGVGLRRLAVGNAEITAAAALALSLGIAIQNFREGAIVSMPLRAEGMKKSRSFLYGVGSGIVEPLGALLTILAAELIVPALPIC